MISHGKKPFLKKNSIELRIVDFEFLSLELVCIKFWSVYADFELNVMNCVINFLWPSKGLCGP